MLTSIYIALRYWLLQKKSVQKIRLDKFYKGAWFPDGSPWRTRELILQQESIRFSQTESPLAEIKLSLQANRPQVVHFLSDQPGFDCIASFRVGDQNVLHYISCKRIDPQGNAANGQMTESIATTSEILTSETPQYLFVAISTGDLRNTKKLLNGEVSQSTKPIKNAKTVEKNIAVREFNDRSCVISDYEIQTFFGPFASIVKFRDGINEKKKRKKREKEREKRICLSFLEHVLFHSVTQQRLEVLGCSKNLRAAVTQFLADKSNHGVYSMEELKKQLPEHSTELDKFKGKILF